MASNVALPEGFEIEYDPSKLPDGFEVAGVPEQDTEQQPKYLTATISAAPKHNILTGMQEAFNWFAQIPFSAYSDQSQNIEAASLRTKGIMSRKGLTEQLTQDEQARLDYLNNPIYSNMRYNQSNNYAVPQDVKYMDEGSPVVLPERGVNWAKQQHVANMQQIPILWEMIKAGGVHSVVGAIAGAGVGFAVNKTPAGKALDTFKDNAKPALKSIPIVGDKMSNALDAIPTDTLSGARQGALWLGRVGAARKMFEIETGFQRQELEYINQEIIKNGGNPLTEAEMDNLSLAVGSVNAGLEFYGAEKILKTLPGGKELSEYLSKGQIRDLAKDVTFREQLSTMAKNLAAVGITEGSTEFMQGVSSMVANRSAKNIGGLKQNPLSKDLSQAMQEGVTGAVSAMFLGGVGTTAQVVTIKARQGFSKKEATTEAQKMTLEERNTFINDNFETLIESVKNLPDIRELEAKQNIENIEYTKILNSGVKDKTLAWEQAKFNTEAIASLAKNTGINVEEVASNFNTVYQNLSDKEALAQHGEVLQGRVEIKKSSVKNLAPNHQARSSITKSNNAENPNIYFQSAMRRSRFNDFSKFHKDVLSKPKNSNDKEQFNASTKGGFNLRIPHDTILHEQKKHKLTAEEWQDLLDNVDKVSDHAISRQKARFNGKPVLLKVNTANSVFGVVIEVFEKNNPIITTAFVDNENSIDNWIKNEAIPSGESPNFLGNGLSSIITNVQPKFKPFGVKNFDQFQSGLTGLDDSIDKNKNNFNGDVYFQNNEGSREDNIVDLTNEFDKTPTFQDVKDYIAELIEKGTQFATLSPDWFVDIRKESSNRKQKRINDKIANAGNYKNIGREGRNRHNKYVISLEKLLNNAEYLGANENTKKDKKPNIEKYHYFKTNIKINDKVYELIFDTEEYKNPQGVGHAKRALKVPQEDTNSITDDSENVNPKTIINNNQKVPALADYAERSSKEARADTINSITDDSENVNPKTVHLYNITEVRNSQNSYHQDGERGIDNSKGFTYQRTNFDGTVKENIVVLLKNKADKSTLMHEFAHVYLTTLSNLSLQNDKAKDLLVTVNRWLRYNGKEYTTAQHEKFAKNFVAYVRTGKAPTYGLKRVFESFKGWLNDIYNQLQFDQRRDFELDEGAKDIFDELLGNLSVNIKQQKSVELIEKAQHNARLFLNEDYAKIKKIQPNTLTQRQRNYRDTAYNILWYGLYNSKNQDGKPLIKDMAQLKMLLGNPNLKNKGLTSQMDKLRLFVAELDDPYSSGDGMLSGWREFFQDPGVSYENDEVGADAELAMAALDVIENKRYLYEEKLFDDFSQNDVKQTEYEFEYILNEYKNAKSEDEKTIVISAFFDWADSVHEYIVEDIVNQWESQTNEIDRYNNLDKFQQAKEDLKITASKMQGCGDYSRQFAEYTRKILKRLDFLSEQDKAKIFGKLKEFNSFREIERNIDEVMEYAETLDEVSYRKSLADKIEKEVKQTIHEVVKGIKKTKYDYPTNTLFERLREVFKKPKEEIQELHDAIVNEEYLKANDAYNAESQLGYDFYNDLENSLIQYLANGKYYNPTELLETLLDKIQRAKFAGKIARDEADFKRQMESKNLINDCKDAVDEHKKVTKLEKFNIINTNFNGILEAVFDKNIKETFNLDLLFAEKDARVGDDREAVLGKIADAFGYTKMRDMQLFNKFIDMNKEKFDIFQRYTPEKEQDMGWQPEKIQLSKMEILGYYIESKNPTSFEMLTDMDKGQFFSPDFDEMMEKLSPQEKLMGDILQSAAEKYYPELNRYYIKKHHIEMGKVKNYFPRPSQITEINELDLLNDYQQKSTNPKYVKRRSAGPGVRIAPMNPVNMLFSHIEKANTLIVMGDKLDLVNRVLRNQELINKIGWKFNEVIQGEFVRQVTDMLYGSQMKKMDALINFFRDFMGNAVGAQIIGKPNSFIKQGIAFLNYSSGDKNVSTGEWWKSAFNAWNKPKETIKFMMKDKWLKDRYARGGSTDAMKRQLESIARGKISLLNQPLSVFVRAGDIAAIIFGGKPYIDVLMNKGYTEEQARELFRTKTIDEQQSSITSNLSNFQRSAMNNPLTMIFTAYQNAPAQYLRKSLGALVKAQKNLTEIDFDSIPSTELQRQELASNFKTFALFWYGFPFAFNLVGSGSLMTLALTGDDDELKKDALTSLLGPISCIPLFGELMRASLGALTGETYFGSNDLFSRHYRNTTTLISHALKLEVTLKDVIRAVTLFTEDYAGISLETFYNELSGVGDVLTGKPIKGLLRTTGYTEARSKIITGETK